jgi:hypothetical protein
MGLGAWCLVDSAKFGWTLIWAWHSTRRCTGPSSRGGQWPGPVRPGYPRPEMKSPRATRHECLLTIGVADNKQAFRCEEMGASLHLTEETDELRMLGKSFPRWARRCAPVPSQSDVLRHPSRASTHIALSAVPGTYCTCTKRSQYEYILQVCFNEMEV